MAALGREGRRRLSLIYQYRYVTERVQTLRYGNRCKLQIGQFIIEEGELGKVAVLYVCSETTELRNDVVIGMSEGVQDLGGRVFFTHISFLGLVVDVLIYLDHWHYHCVIRHELDFCLD